MSGLIFWGPQTSPAKPFPLPPRGEGRGGALTRVSGIRRLEFGAKWEVGSAFRFRGGKRGAPHRSASFLSGGAPSGVPRPSAFVAPSDGGGGYDLVFQF